MIRIGKIRVSRNIIEENNLEIFKKLFSEIYPINIEWDYREAVYTCISLLFDEVEESEEIPFYEVSLTVDNEKEDYYLNVEKL